MPTTAESMITKKQIRMIHTLKNAMKMSDEKYRKIISINFYPATSSKELTCKKAEALIDGFSKMAIEKGVWSKFTGKTAYNDLGSRENMGTPAQLRMIEAMWKDVSIMKDVNGRQKALRSWLYNKFKVSDLRFLDSLTVGKAITALKQMKKTKQQNRVLGPKQG